MFFFLQFHFVRICSGWVWCRYAWKMVHIDSDRTVKRRSKLAIVVLKSVWKPRRGIYYVCTVHIAKLSYGALCSISAVRFDWMRWDGKYSSVPRCYCCCTRIRMHMARGICMHKTRAKGADARIDQFNLLNANNNMLDICLFHRNRPKILHGMGSRSFKDMWKEGRSSVFQYTDLITAQKKSLKISRQGRDDIFIGSLLDSSI